MDWSVAEVVQRQALFSTALVRQFMKKLRKYQNLMLKNKVNITDSGYGSSLHTSKSYDDDIELVLQENSTSADYCKSFWSFGSRVSVLRLFQWVYRIVQRTKAARILCHLDAVPENDIEATVIEVAKELSVAFEYQLMMLYSDVEVIKLADHAVCCLQTYLNTCESEFTCASLLQAILEIKPLTGNKKEIVRTREVTHNGTSYCLCWKLWQVLKQPGLRLQPHHMYQENNQNTAENQPISNSLQMQPSPSMEAPLLPGSVHKDFTYADDSSINVDGVDQVYLDKKETDTYNQCQNSSLTLETRLVNIEVNTSGNHDETLNTNSTNMMEVLNNGRLIESIPISEDAVNIKQDQSEHLSKRERKLESLSWSKSIKVTSDNEKNFSGIQNENIQSDKYTSETTSEATQLENDEIDKDGSTVWTQQTTAVEDPVLTCTLINMTLADTGQYNEVTHTQEEDTSINCSSNIKYWNDTKNTNENEYKEEIRENKDARFFKDTEDITSLIQSTAEDVTITAPFNPAQDIKSNNLGLVYETKKNGDAPERAKEHFLDTLVEVSPSIIMDVFEKDSLDNVYEMIENNDSVSNMANVSEAQNFSDEKSVNENHDTNLSSEAEAVKYVTLTEKKSQEDSSENEKIHVILNDSESFKQHLQEHDGTEVQGSQVAIDAFIGSDKNSEMYKETNGSFRTVCERSTLAPDLSSLENVSGIVNVPNSFGHACIIDSQIITGNNAYDTSYASCSSNQFCGAYKSDENISGTNQDLSQTHTANISDGNRLMVNVFPTLDKTKAVEHETFLPSTIGTSENTNMIYTSVVPEFENTCSFTSLSAEEGKGSTITDHENISSNVKLAHEYENTLQRSDIKAEHRITLQSVDKSSKHQNDTSVNENSMAEHGILVTKSENVSAVFEHEETQRNEDISEPQSKQELGFCSSEYSQEVPCNFYGCFTPFGAKCRPHVYGFRGPLHVWNETEAQVTLVYNDRVTTVNSRARQIPFSTADIHQAYIPKTCCKH